MNTPFPQAILRCAALLAVLVVASLPAVFGHSSVGQAAALYDLTESSNPYFQPAHGLLLYLWTPLVAMSSCLLFLAPGLVLALAIGAARTTGQWIVCGFALSLFWISFAAAILQSTMQVPLRGTSFALVVLGCLALSFPVLLARTLACTCFAWPWQQAGFSRTVTAMLIGPWLILIALAPKFYWENFNGDGVHAFESARLLLSQATPFWPSSAGEISNFPSLNSSLFAFANSWFIRLFGEFEAAARLPLLLYLMALFAVIIAVVEHERERILSAVEHMLIWLQLAVYVVVMAYSATYNPYFADLALPATQDTQMMVCLLGLVMTYLYRSIAWMCLFIFMLSLSLPSGLPLAALFMAGLLLTWKPRPWRFVITAAATMVGCMLLGVVLPMLMKIYALPVPGSEYAAANLAERLNLVASADAIHNNLGHFWPHLRSRMMYLLLPCGILPALFLVRWGRQDALARSLTLLTAVYYLLFFIQPNAALHHFVPVMIVPLVVFWRISLTPHSRWQPWLTAVAAIVAIAICLPRQMRLHTEAKLVGSAIENRIDGYEQSNPRVFSGSELLIEVIPYVWDAARSGTYGGSPLMWNYYAHHAEHAGAADRNYVLQAVDDPPPNDMDLIVRRDGLALYMKSAEIRDKHRSMKPAIGFAAHVFTFPGGRTWVAKESPTPGTQS